MKKIAHIVLSEHFAFIESHLSYFFDTKKLNLKVGDTVLVPFGQKKKLYGVVIDIVDEVSEENSKLKEVIAKLPYSLPKHCIDTARQMSKYYFAPLQTCIKLFLPKKIWTGESQEKTEIFWSLHPQFSHEVFGKLRGEKQKVIISILQEEGELVQKKLLEPAEATTATLKNLEEKQLIRKEERKTAKEEFIIRKGNLHTLNNDQQKALEVILENKTTLLHGVTGAGKTEVFMHLFQSQLEKDSTSQGLFLVPEIALTPQMISYIQNTFPKGVAIIHSQLSDGEKCNVWRKVESGEIRLIIGSRSALFLPWKNLKTVVLDEEHEWTYKSDKTPKYHARKVAELFLQNQKDCHLVLASATPDICHMYEAKNENIALAELKTRVGDIDMPKVSIIDMREEYARKNYSSLAGELQHKIKRVLERGKQVVLFLNKRGYAKSIQCTSCGHIETCDHCDIPFTHHTNARDPQGKLICHYCFVVKPVPQTCSKCKSTDIQKRGQGTQKVELEIQKLFPKARILRADRDSTAKKGEFEAMYNAMKNNEADILLGTQMISKGLDLENIELVGVLQAEQGLHIPDFRSSEKVFQLLTQVAGRAGRKGKGEVIFQTFMPFHEVVQNASLHSYSNMYTQLIEERKLLKYPPFSNVIKFTFVSKNKKECLEKSKKLKQELEKTSQNTIRVTSAPSFIPKIADKYYWNVVIRGESTEKIFLELQKNSPELLENWRVDRDPVFLS